MPEKCVEPCADILRLEQQMKDLQKQNGDDHKEFRDELHKLEKEEAVQSERYTTILDKLDNLSEKVDALESKPGKRWDSLVACIISSLATAFVMWMALGMPGVSK